jgi:hypothetical protein
MADFVATIHVPAGQSVWPADEVPHLTADALYRFEPEPDPMVPKAELRRFTSGDPTNRTAGLPLSARELSQLDRKCKAAGMSGLPDGLPHRQWGEYLEAFNQDAEARGWWAGLIPPRDPHQAERLAWVIAAEEHRKLLKAAIAGGEIQARMAGTLVPAPAGLIALDRLVLTLEGLEKFAALLAIQVAPAEGEPAEAVAVVPACDRRATGETAPLPLSTGDIAYCFAGLRWSEEEWKKPLGDKPKWLKTCVAIPGRRGVSETRWDPVRIGAALVRAGHAKPNSVRAKFQTVPPLKPWLETWKTYEAEYIDTE